MAIARKQIVRIKNHKLSFMKHLITTLLLLSVFCVNLQAQIAIIPKPNEIKHNDGKFSYVKGFDVKIIRGDDPTKLIQKQFIDFVKEKNIPVVPFSSVTVSLNLLQAGSSAMSPESYTLSVTPNSIAISATGNAGLFYGVQTLEQLIKTDSFKIIPCMEIKDVPAFSYRGFHLDAAHLFLSTEVIKQYLDAMAKLKLNQFHWQIADEQAWHIQLKSNDSLTSKVDFYTQEQVKDIVKYAKERYINVIPEINLSSVSFGEDTTFQIRKNVLDEVISLFPGAYIHVGKQIDFIEETQRYLTSKSKKIIETDNSFFDKSVVQSYKNTSNGTKAAALGNDVIMSPRNLCSLDFYQDWDDEKKAFYMSFLPLDKAYSFNPVSKIKDDKILSHILGAQACAPTLYIKNEAELEYLVFPRLLALAESMWTKKENKKFADFEKRLKRQKNYFFKEKEEPKIDLVRIKTK